VLESWMFGRIGPWRSLASALAWGARGPEFKSRRPDQSFQRVTDLKELQGVEITGIMDQCEIDIPCVFFFEAVVKRHAFHDEERDRR
jgi:hypothetical protein